MMGSAKWATFASVAVWAAAAVAVEPCVQNCAEVRVVGGSAQPGDTVAVRLHFRQGPDDGTPDQGNDDIAAIALTVGMGGPDNTPLVLADCSDADGDGLPDSVRPDPAIADSFRVVLENAYCTGRNRCLCPTSSEQERDWFLNIVVFGPKELPPVGPVNIPVLPDEADLVRIDLRVQEGTTGSVPLVVFDQTDDSSTKPMFGALLSVGDRVAIDQTCEADCGPGDRSRVTAIDGAVEVEAACAGDCDGDGSVTINELIRGVNIALGNAPVSSCPAFDIDGNQTVAINELIRGVTNGLNGCM